MEILTKKELLYKVLVIGDIGAGKTSLIKRTVHGIFSIHYKSTIGVDFALKVIPWDENTNVRLQLWDIAGQERFGNMTRVYYKEAVGCLLVFDVTRQTTFDAVKKWKLDLDAKVSLSNDDEPIPAVLIANKIDLPNPEDEEDIYLNDIKPKLDDYCRDNGFVAWFETSAKDNIGIDNAIRKLVDTIIEKIPIEIEINDESRIKVEPTPEPIVINNCC